MLKNFPPNFPWYKKLGAHITYHFSKIILFPRKNLLSKADIQAARKIIAPWDIILCGNYRETSALFIPGLVTHTIAYIDKGRCVHSSAHGVRYLSLRKVLRIYDSLLILQPFWKEPSQKLGYLESIIAKLGAPYDFYFGLGEREYFCSWLINSSLLEAWYETGLHTVRPVDNFFDEVTDDILRAHRALKPEDFIRGNFKAVFYSHNISCTDGKFELIKD